MTRPLPVHEEHGEVVATWRALGYQAETVVCFDRHLDLKPLDVAAIAQLRQAGSVEALRSLNRPLPVRDAPGAYGLDDFFAAGPVTGAVRALWWVMPGRWPDARTRIRTALDALARIPADADTLAHTRVSQGVLHTRLCGLDLQVHSLETLQACGIPDRARVDVDLDWLADGDAPAQHTPRELAGLMGALACTARLDSLTWSVRSGFLSPAMRGVAQELADLLGRRLAPVDWKGAWPIPERTLAALRGTVTRAQRTSLQAELAPLGAIGVALDGCLAVRAGAVDEAEAAWWKALQGGVHSSWLAHGIGVARYDEQPAQAVEWLDRAAGSCVDTLEVHAASLAVMCLLRSGRRDEAQERAERLAQRHPLHRKLVRTASLLAGDGVQRERSATRERFIETLTAWEEA